MSTNTTNFKKPPLSDFQKERLANQFIEGPDVLIHNKIKKQTAGKTKTLYLRVPEAFYTDIQEIIELTGLSMNAVCCELLRPSIKHKLKELKNDY